MLLIKRKPSSILAGKEHIPHLVEKLKSDNVSWSCVEFREVHDKITQQNEHTPIFSHCRDIGRWTVSIEISSKHIASIECSRFETMYSVGTRRREHRDHGW